MAVNPGHISDYFGVDLLGKTRSALDSRPYHRRDWERGHPIAISFGSGRAFKKGSGFQPSFPKAGPFGPHPDHRCASGGNGLHRHGCLDPCHRGLYLGQCQLPDRSSGFPGHGINLWEFITAYARGEDLEARSKMLEGSLLAGMAFANAGVTAVHAFAYLWAESFITSPMGWPIRLCCPVSFVLTCWGISLNLPIFLRHSDCFRRGLDRPAGGGRRAGGHRGIDDRPESSLTSYGI